MSILKTLKDDIVWSEDVYYLVRLRLIRVGYRLTLGEIFKSINNISSYNSQAKNILK